jgi:hydrogenase expression/formation protein HypE
VANEGKLVAVVPEPVAGRLLDTMHHHEYGTEAAIIGAVVSDHPGIVVISTGFGVNRILDMPVGEQLPRIC